MVNYRGGEYVVVNYRGGEYVVVNYRGGENVVVNYRDCEYVVKQRVTITMAVYQLLSCQVYHITDKHIIGEDRSHTGKRYQGPNGGRAPTQNQNPLSSNNSNIETRLISIESHPKKVVVVVVVVFAVFVVVIIVGHKNLTLKFGQNWVNDKGYIVVVVFIVLVLFLLLIQIPSFETWFNSGH